MKNVSLLAFAALSLMSLSCRAATEQSGAGTASVSLTLSGVLPAGASGTSRVILPTTNSVGITVSRGFVSSSEPGTVIYSRTVAASSGTAPVVVEGLPDGEALNVAVTAYSGSTPLSSAAATAVLVPGENELGLKLVPVGIGSAQQVTVSGSATFFFIGSDIPVGGISYSKVSVTDTIASGAWQILFSTGSDSRTAWLKAYDADWNPLPTVASDASGSWAVVRNLGTTAIWVVVCNNSSTPGYPSSPIVGTSSSGASIQFRNTVFASADGADGNPGTPDQPTSIGSVGVAGESSSCFLSGGTYQPSGLTLLGGIRIYGGFKPGDWAVRDPASYETVIAGSVYQQGAINLGTSITTFSGCLDGLTVKAPAAGSYLQTGAVYANYVSAPAFIRNCTLEASAVNNIDAQNSTIYFAALVGNISATSALEVTESRLAGSHISSQTINSSTMAVRAEAGTYYIHNSDLDGGAVSSTETSYTGSTCGVYVSSSADVVLASCRVWGGLLQLDAESSGSSCGVYTSSSGTVAIANSLLSGGYADAPYRSAVAVSAITSSLDLVGNTVDSGSFPDSAIYTPYCLYAGTSLASPATSVANVFCSGYSTSSPLISEKNSGSYNMRGNAFITQAPDAVLSSGTTSPTFSGISAMNWANNVTNAAGVASAFAGYRSSTSYADWLQSDLRCVLGLSPNVCGASFFPDGWTDLYPALLLDRAGNARSTSTAWLPGAWE